MENVLDFDIYYSLYYSFMYKNAALGSFGNYHDSEEIRMKKDNNDCE